MKNKGLNTLLIERIPELKEEYLEYISWSDDGSHNVFGDVLNPFLEKELEEMENEELLSRIFHFLEEMAISGDEYIESVLITTVLWRVTYYKHILDKAKSLMGEKTIEYCIEYEKWLQENM